MDPTPEMTKWIAERFADQDAGREISPGDHKYLLVLIDLGVVGTDGFRYCWPWEAKENWERIKRCRPVI
jgi:hypothetical protein